MALDPYIEYAPNHTVWARKVVEPESVVSRNGIENALPGDYVVSSDEGYHVVPGNAFEEAFSEVNKNTKK